MLEKVDGQFGQLVRLAGKLSDHRYRFAMLHHFKEFDNSVWIMPGGRKVKIIN